MNELYDLACKAIKSALSGKWQEAALLNQQILSVQPNNLNALLRLAKAYINLHKSTLAKRTYKKALNLDRYNPIAKRNLNRLNKYKNRSPSKDISTSTSVFLEEPGKTRSVFLVRLTDEHNLALLEIGEAVKLNFHPKSVCITKNDKYLGRLPDDIAFRLIHLVKTGNQYESYVRLLEKDKLQIFIREVKKSKRNAQIPSFPPRNDNCNYQSFMPIQLIQDESTDTAGDETEAYL